MTPRELALLKQCGRSTPAGRALRRHWLPVLPESRLPEPDGEPVSLRVLGEPLVLFRDSAGRIGVIDAYCPHESGSLALGLNADGGLQCMLHGWKFDVEGNRVDSGAVHSGAARTKAYPVAVHQGLVWLYMGEEHGRPALPETAGRPAAQGV